jgi:cell division protein ZapA
MNQLEVQIMGQSYLLGCPEGGEDRLRDAVGKVDSAMCKIRDAGKLKARDRIAVLAALNLAFELSDRATAPPAPAAANDPLSANPQQLANLMARLDQALGDDGRLL